MSHKNLVKSVFWVTLSEIIFNLSGYVIHSAVGRILGPSDYGRYGLVVTLTTMVIILIGNGIPTAMSKYLSEVFESRPGMISIIKKQAIRLQFILIGGITLVFFFLSPVIAWLLKDSTLTPLFQISTLIIPAFAAASFYFYYYTGLHEFKLQSVLKTVRSVLKVVAIISLAYFFQLKGSVVGYVVAPGLVFLVAFLIDKFWISKKIALRIQKKETTGEYLFDYKKLINYAWPLTLFMLFYEFLISIDLYLVKGILENDYLTGIYNGALTVGRLPYYLFYALSIILLPVISKTTFENRHSETHKIVSQSLRLMVILLFPGVILMLVFALPIIQFFYGSEFLASAIPMSILSLGVGFLTIFYVMSFVVNGAGKVRVPMWISFWGLLINILLNYIFIKNWSIVGSATATSITSFLIMLVMLVFVRREFGVFLRLKSLSKIILASATMLWVSIYLPKTEDTFIFYAIFLLAIYFAVLLVLQEIKKEDWQVFRKLTGKK